MQFLAACNTSILEGKTFSGKQAQKCNWNGDKDIQNVHLGGILLDKLSKIDFYEKAWEEP